MQQTLLCRKFCILLNGMALTEALYKGWIGFPGQKSLQGCAVMQFHDVTTLPGNCVINDVIVSTSVSVLSEGDHSQMEARQELSTFERMQYMALTLFFIFRVHGHSGNCISHVVKVFSASTMLTLHWPCLLCTFALRYCFVITFVSEYDHS